MDRQAVGAHDRLNRARKTPSPATDILMIVVRDAGSVLVPEDAIPRTSADIDTTWGQPPVGPKGVR